MQVFKILHYPHVLLRKKSTPVAENFLTSKDLQSFVDGMVETMYAHQGIGLAAAQVGILKRIMVVDIKPYLGNPDLKDWHGSHQFEKDGVPTQITWPLRLVNPVITPSPETVRFPFDGCLSLPGVSSTDTTRAKSIELKATDPWGAALTLKCDGILSICLQHEMDHLEGVLFIDRLLHPEADSDIQAEIASWEDDPAVRKLERKLKPVDARKTKYDFVSVRNDPE